MYIDPDTLHKNKMAVKDAYTRQLLIGFPISFFFVSLVVGCQVGLQWQEEGVKEEDIRYTEKKVKVEGEDEDPVYLKYLPGLVNALLIVTFGAVYKWLTKSIVRNENHRYVSSFENSMINKTYLFQFVNTYISNFVAIIYLQDFAVLQLNLIIVMVVKQLGVNIFEWLSEKIIVGRAVKKVDKLF